MRFALTTAVVAAIALLAVANGQSTDCVSDVLHYCTNTYSPTTSCCNIVRKLYRTDRSCLCLIFNNATKSYKDLVILLQGCDESISVADTYVCSSGSFDTSQYYEVNTTTESIKVDFLSKLKLSRTAFIGIVVGVGTVVSVFVIMLVCALIPRRIKLPPPTQAQAQLTGYPQELVAAPLQLQLQGYPQPVVVEAQLQVQGYNQSSSKNQSYGMPQGPAHPTTIVGSSCTIFTYEDLMKASNGFSSENLLSRGGSGVVYRGTLNGIQVAIKQFIAESLMEIEDFKIEIERITHLHHKNLVSLVGYCCTKDRMLMVLELVPNGTLESHLHKGKRGYTMEWSIRMKVALGSAKGLAYLHEDCHPQIVHHDIKATNILLDYEFVPKVADFGLAIKVRSHTVRIVGTPGYIDPEYQSGEQPSTAKSDVYSFGVILLELITGRKPIENNKRLVDWARPLLSQALMDGNCDAIVDERLGNNYSREEMLRVICCSAACIRRSSHRPSMSRVVRILEGLITIEELKQDLLQPNQSFSSSSASFDYESSHQSNAGKGNFNW